VVDYLRTTYDSRFYYSRNPDQYIVGRYSYAASDAQFLELGSIYGSHVWLDEWEQDVGLGDTSEDFTRNDGTPLSSDIFYKKTEVYPLRTGCVSDSPLALTMSDQVLDGVPTKCWKRTGPRLGAYTYRVTVPPISYSSSFGSGVFGGTFLLKWHDPYWYSDDYLGLNGILIYPWDAYPIGGSWYVEIRWGGGVVTGPGIAWFDLPGVYRETLSFRDGWEPLIDETVSWVGDLVLRFEKVTDDSWVNPVDIFT